MSQVLKLADDPDASPKEMERIIERDPAVTAKILRVANSSYYGSNQVASIGRAISMLGMNSIRSLIVGVAYQQIISGRAVASQFNKLEFWRHSLGVATGSRIISKIKIPMKSEEMYVAGMMHDVGLLVMDRFHPLELDKAIQYAGSEEIPLHQAEQLNFGFDHSQLGAILAEKWGLSPIVVNGVRYHHDTEMDEEHHDTTMIISLANKLAHECGLTNNIPNQPCEIEDSLLESVGIPREQLEVIKNVVVQEIARAEEAFQIS